MKQNKNKRPSIGDVFEIKTPEGLAYIQFSHRDQQFGHLLRVLPGIYKQPPDAFVDVVNLKELFYVFFPLGAALSQGIVRWVAHEDIPDWSQKFPLMRMAGWIDESGKVLNWWLYDGEKEWQVDNLTSEQESLSLAQIWNDTLLIERIVGRWSPSDVLTADKSTNKEHTEPDFPLASNDQAVLAALQQAGSDLNLSHSIRHYLYFPTKKAANKVAKTLQAEGYAVEVQRGGDDVSWLTLATHSAIPNIEVITSFRSRLESLAESMQGEYDGWEAAITK